MVLFSSLPCQTLGFSAGVSPFCPRANGCSRGLSDPANGWKNGLSPLSTLCCPPVVTGCWPGEPFCVCPLIALQARLVTSWGTP